MDTKTQLRRKINTIKKNSDELLRVLDVDVDNIVAICTSPPYRLITSDYVAKNSHAYKMWLHIYTAACSPLVRSPKKDNIAKKLLSTSAYASTLLRQSRIAYEIIKKTIDDDTSYTLFENLAYNKWAFVTIINYLSDNVMWNEEVIKLWYIILNHNDNASKIIEGLVDHPYSKNIHRQTIHYLKTSSESKIADLMAFIDTKSTDFINEASFKFKNIPEIVDHKILDMSPYNLDMVLESIKSTLDTSTFQKYYNEASGTADGDWFKFKGNFNVPSNPEEHTKYCRIMMLCVDNKNSHHIINKHLDSIADKCRGLLRTFLSTPRFVDVVKNCLIRGIHIPIGDMYYYDHLLPLVYQFADKSISDFHVNCEERDKLVFHVDSVKFHFMYEGFMYDFNYTCSDELGFNKLKNLI